MTTVEIIMAVLNVLLVSGGLVTLLTIRSTIRKSNIEVKQADTEATTSLMKAFEEHILQPVLTECQELRKKDEATNKKLELTNRKLDRLSRAIEKIPACKYSHQCPVSCELQKSAADEQHDPH